MTAIREPSEPMGEDLECSVVINQFNSEGYILIQNEIYEHYTVSSHLFMDNSRYGNTNGNKNALYGNLPIVT